MKPWMGLVLLLAGCGSTPAPAADGGTAASSLLGVWQTTTAGVSITVTFSGTADSGVVETLQSSPVTGDTPTCRAEMVGTGTFVVTGSSVTLDTPSGVQRTRGCTAPDGETPLTDPTPLQNFASALSGPFVLTATTLTLGSSYPTLTRLTR